MMSVGPVSSGLVIRETTAPAAPSPEVLDCVEHLWRQEQRRHAAPLIDGRIFSVATREATLITAWEAPYKWWIAQRSDPKLFSVLGLRPLAVSGVIHLREGLVLGRRWDGATQDAGLWELPPSGSVDLRCRRAGGVIAADEQILVELEEELNVPLEYVSGLPEPVALLEDDHEHVIDIVYRLCLKLNVGQLQDFFGRADTHEYTALQVIETGKLAKFPLEISSLSPASATLLRYFAMRDEKQVWT